MSPIDSRPSLLVAIRDAGLARLVELAVESSGAVGVRCHSAGDLARCALASRPVAVILDAGLPGGTSEDALEQLRALEATRNLPVILLVDDYSGASLPELTGAPSLLTFLLPVSLSTLRSALATLIVPASG